MARPTDWHNLELDSDPTPGDPYEIRSQGTRFCTFADDVDSAYSTLNTASKDTTISEWNGKAGEAFRGQIGKLPGQLQKLRDSYRMAGNALIRFANGIELEQASADAALVKARRLRQDLSTAQTDLTNAKNATERANTAKTALDSPSGGNVPKPDPAQVRQASRNVTEANNHQANVASRVSGIQAQLAELKSKAETARDNHNDYGKTLKSEIDNASDAGIHNKHWWQKVGDFLAKAWDVLIVVAKVVVAIGGIVLLFVGGPLALIVLAAALLILADTLVKFAQGKAGWGDVLFAALDCIPAVGKLAMLAKAGKFGSKIGLGLKVAKAEKQFASVIKVWRAGSELKGFSKVAFTFGKGMGKDTLKDFLNGGWGRVQQNAVKNLTGNVIGAGTGPLVEKGFAKIPRLVYRGDIADMPAPMRRDLGELAMTMNGKTDFGKAVIGAGKGFATSITKETVNSTVFGSDFNYMNVGVGTATGVAGGSGVGYKPGLTPAKQYM